MDDSSESQEIDTETAPSFEEIIEDAPVQESDTIIDESVIAPEEATIEESQSIENDIENAVSTEQDTSLDDISFDDEKSSEDLSFDFSDEKLEEPEIDNFIPDGNDELYENEDLPDEISIPKEEDLLVESNSSDFMDSVKETTDEETSAPEIEQSSDSDIPTVDKLLSPEDEEASFDSDDAPFCTVDNLISASESEAEQPLQNETSNEIIEETEVPSVDAIIADSQEDEPVIEETSVNIEENSESFDEVDNLDNNLSESNLAYLDKNDTTEESMANTDLKQDIKSVLLYMDQLLENLPEEKIVEFAKSEEFVTYKKLFNELGLS
ncbi:MAG: hypothetical protein J6X84_00890 [Treponema sp.]|nr:hypothetical protein [Treponema sp.]